MQHESVIGMCMFLHVSTFLHVCIININFTITDYTVQTLPGGADYQDFMATLTFPTGSGSGARECTDVQILDDDIVEADEIFNLTASIITPFPGASLNVSMGSVTIIDEDGTYMYAH